MAKKNNAQAILILSGLILIGAFVVGAYQLRAWRHAHHYATRRFAPVHHLEHGGYCYQDGQNWWYYDTVFTDSGGTYSPTASAWVPSAKSPAENNLRLDAAKDVSDPEEVELGSQGQPEPAVMTAAEAAELESQISDMVNEGNPNSQEMAESDDGAEDSDSDGGNSDNCDAGGGDAGGDSGGGGGDGD